MRHSVSAAGIFFLATVYLAGCDTFNCNGSGGGSSTGGERLADENLYSEDGLPDRDIATRTLRALSWVRRVSRFRVSFPVRPL
jgi:hypothetical protein